MRLVGLTGGIASGKSTVSAMLRELGATVLDADVLAREVVAPGSACLGKIAARFPGVLDDKGALDRRALAKRVFNDENERAALNAIIHPYIQQAFLERTEALRQARAPLVIYDAPLLIENGLHTAMDGGVIVVWVPRDVQLRRLMARDNLSAEDAERRISTQLSLDEKRRHATWVIDNSGSVEQTRQQVERLWKSLSP